MRVRSLRRFLLAGTCTFSFIFTTLDLIAADNLPKGVRAAAFVFVSAEGVREGFNDTGLRQSLTYDLNRSVTIDELAKFEPELEQLKAALNEVNKDEKFGDSLLLADLYADVNVSERRYVSALMWGVTSKLMLGVQVPYIRRDTKATFRVKSVNNADKIKKIVGTEMPKIAEGLDRLANTPLDTEVFAKSLFTDNGYKTPSSFSLGGLGDIELDARYGYFSSNRISLQLRSGIKVPTAQHRADLHNLIDRDLDDPFYSYKLGSHHHFKIIPSFVTLKTSVSGVYRQPFKKVTGVKKSPDQSLPNLNDPEQIALLKYEKGILLDAQAGVAFDIYKGAFSLGVNYGYTHSPQVKVSGPSGLDYSFLTQASESTNQILEFSAELSSIPLFLSGKMPLPGKFVLTWSQPVAGRNSTFTPYGRMDMIMLF